MDAPSDVTRVPIFLGGRIAITAMPDDLTEYLEIDGDPHPLSAKNIAALESGGLKFKT
jgi:hypothetical protein